MDNIIKAQNILTTENIDAMFFNTQDEFLSEFTKPENNDIFQITGFTGSNGYLLITPKIYIFFTDGRYTLQAQNELPQSFEIHNIIDFWIVIQKMGLQKLTLNFAKVSAEFALKLQNTLPKVKLVHLKHAFSKPFVNNGGSYPIESGKSSQEKIHKITEHLHRSNKDGFFIADPQSVCWILNIRGNDEQHTPIHKVTMFIKNDGAYELNPDFSQIVGNIFIDSQSTFMQYNSIVAQKEFNSYIVEKKVIKNKIEITGMVNAHKVDGKIVSQFLHWLAEYYEGKTEWDIAQKLLEFRMSHESFKILSFATICGCNENGAIIHYNPQKETAKTVTQNSVILIDSGGQFYGHNILGTTDITRTLFLGNANPSEEYKQAFTLVLKGHIAVAMAIFKEDTPSNTFDKLARKYLKEHKMDYAHSTGHGVGSFLAVHEAGCGISSSNARPLKEGMVISNEPGYYLEGTFGIRIESLLLVCKNAEGNLYFQTITLVAIQEKSINFTMLTQEEKQWIEEYNKKCIYNLSHTL